jgi:putative hydrolase of the HAD superfamily
MAAPISTLDWSTIDTVLTDLDGTLLDLAYDNRFWLERVPQAYAAARGLSPEQARSALSPRFRACEGQLSWYCIEHWSRELELDLVALKSRSAHEVAWLPGARQFLDTLRARGKRLVLLTNAHPIVLDLKDRRTGITSLVDAAFSSHRFGVPKEDPRFWHAVRAVEPFPLESTLFIDDSPAVLGAARAAGIRFVVGIRRPDSVGTERDHAEFPAVDSVGELL